MPTEPDHPPLALPVAQPPYPALHLIARHGHAIAIAASLAIAAIGIAAWASGAGWGFAAFGIAGGALAYLLLRAFAELVHLLVDTMIPR